MIRYRLKIITAMSLLLICMALGNILIITTVNPTSNDECLWVPLKQDTLAIRFENVKVGGVSWNGGIRDGDFLIAINKTKITSTAQAQMILNRVNGGDYAEYTVKKKSGRMLETKVYIKKLINFSSLGISLLGFCWLIVAFIVLMAKPDGRVQRVFYGVGATLILMLLIIYQTLPFVAGFTPLVLLVDILSSGGFIYGPFLIIHFFWIFPHEYEFAKKKIVNYLMYLLPAAILIGLIVFRFLFVYDSPDRSRHFELFLRAANIAFGIAFITGFVSLLINYFRLKTPGERKPLSIIFISYLLAILVILYTVFVAPAITDTIFNSPEFYMPMIILFILPVAFGYSIF
ncbi:MAG TPA: PDZ domain-containing protein, partial [Ignavibacteriaceae bacterium]